MAFSPACLLGDEGPASQQTTAIDCSDDADGHTVLLDEEDSADDGYKCAGLLGMAATASSASLPLIVDTPAQPCGASLTCLLVSVTLLF